MSLKLIDSVAHCPWLSRKAEQVVSHSFPCVSSCSLSHPVSQHVFAELPVKVAAAVFLFVVRDVDVSLQCVLQDHVSYRSFSLEQCQVCIFQTEQLHLYWTSLWRVSVLMKTYTCIYLLSHEDLSCVTETSMRLLLLWPRLTTGPSKYWKC